MSTSTQKSVLAMCMERTKAAEERAKAAEEKLAHLQEVVSGFTGFMKQCKKIYEENGKDSDLMTRSEIVRLVTEASKKPEDENRALSQFGDEHAGKIKGINLL